MLARARTILLKSPIEFFVVGIFPLLLFTTLFIFSDTALERIAAPFEFGTYGYFIYFTVSFITRAVNLLLFYLFIRLEIILILVTKEFITNPPQDKWQWFLSQIKRLWPARGIVFLSFITAVSSIFLCFGVVFLGTLDPDRILQTDLLLMSWDHAVFGVYLPFWMQGQTWSLQADTYMLVSYNLLVFVLTVTLLGLLALGKTKIFRTMLLSVFITPLLALPIWATFPAVTPNELYRKNIFDLPPTDQTTIYAIEQSKLIGPQTEELLTGVSDLQSDVAVGHYHVPTFPSMHIAWGTIATYFSFLIAWPLGIIVLLWWFFNAGGAVMSLQHFGVDIFSGIGVGVLAIWLAHYLLRLEKKHLRVSDGFFSILNTFPNDLKRLERFIKEFYNKHKRTIN